MDEIAPSSPHPLITTPNTVVDKPSVAVLPFSNSSNDATQDYFADGIAEDIITALSRCHDLFVIARNSSFTYRGATIDAVQAGRELNVLYVLEGSIRVAGSRLRITTQLTDVKTDKYVWAERFDCPLHDVFVVQDEIAVLILSTVTQQSRVAEISATLLRNKNDLKVRDLIVRAQRQMDGMTQSHFDQARKLCTSAVEQHAESVAAHSLLAYINIMELLHARTSQSPLELMTNAATAARKATGLDPDDEGAKTYLAAVYWMSGNHDLALSELDAVIKRNPNYAAAIGMRGKVYAFSGGIFYADAVTNLEHAIRLSPNDPLLQFFLTHRGTAEFFHGDFDEAIVRFYKAIKINPDFSTPYRLQASAYGLSGEIEKARDALANVIRLEKKFSIAEYGRRLKQVFKHERDFELFVNGLRLAGAPED
jgi:adenylate cyclase